MDECVWMAAESACPLWASWSCERDSWDTLGRTSVSRTHSWRDNRKWRNRSPRHLSAAKTARLQLKSRHHEDGSSAPPPQWVLHSVIGSECETKHSGPLSRSCWRVSVVTLCYSTADSQQSFMCSDSMDGNRFCDMWRSCESLADVSVFHTVPRLSSSLLSTVSFQSNSLFWSVSHWGDRPPLPFVPGLLWKWSRTRSHIEMRERSMEHVQSKTWKDDHKQNCCSGTL